MSEISIENTTATCGILWYEEVEVENTLHISGHYTCDTDMQK